VGIRRIVYASRQSACVTPEEKEACRKMAEALNVDVVEWFADGGDVHSERV
jgi:hypothetical protein